MKNDEGSKKLLLCPPAWLFEVISQTVIRSMVLAGSYQYKFSERLEYSILHLIGFSSERVNLTGAVVERWCSHTPVSGSSIARVQKNQQPAVFSCGLCMAASAQALSRRIPSHVLATARVQNSAVFCTVAVTPISAQQPANGVVKRHWLAHCVFRSSPVLICAG